MQDWNYQNEPFTTALEDHAGFVYLIECAGKYYIGKKTFWLKKKLPPNKSRKRAKVKYYESDWKTYCSSSKEMQKLCKENPDGVVRNILVLCKTKGDMSFFETKAQLGMNVLFDDNSLNGVINCRISRNHLSDELANPVDLI